MEAYQELQDDLKRIKDLAERFLDSIPEFCPDKIVPEDIRIGFIFGNGQETKLDLCDIADLIIMAIQPLSMEFDEFEPLVAKLAPFVSQDEWTQH